MSIYIVFFVLLLLGLFPNPMKKRNGYILFISILLFILIGFRDISVGVDTLSYVNDFKFYGRLDWNGLVRESMTHKEPVFHLIVGLLSKITSYYTIYLCFWALFPVVALYYFFKNELNTKIDVAIAVIVIFILGIYAFFVAGIRQTAAMSILLFSYKYLKRIDKNKLNSLFKNADFIKFILLLVCAYSLHNSSIVFVLTLFVRFFKVRWWYLFIPIGLFFIGNYVDAAQLNILAQYVFEEKYSQYGTSYESSLSIAGFLMQLILFIICFIQKNSLIKSNPSNQALLIFSILGLVFQSMVGIIAEMYRLSFYFGMFNMLLVPRALYLYKKGPIGNLAYWGFIIGGLFYLFILSSANLTEYMFVNEN